MAANCVHLSLVAFLTAVILVSGDGESSTDQLSALHKAATSGDVAEVKRLLENGNVDVVDPSGRTLLHWAALSGRMDVALLLLDKGANVNRIDIEEDTPLHLAAFKGHADTAKLLLDRGAATEARNRVYGLTPLHETMQRGCHPEVARVLLEKGAKVDTKDRLGFTPLYNAVQLCENPELAEVLLNKGANPNIVGGDGNTPLHHAVIRYARISPNIGLVELLLEKGADPNRHYNEGTTVLHLAAKEGKYDLINLLLDKHADPNALDAWQKTPLFYVILYNFRKPDIRLVQLLLERGADPNKRITGNATVLHVAAKEGKYDLINLLLDKHADPNALDTWQKTPLVYVILYNFRKPDIRLVQLLLERGADPNKPITENATVLHLAAKEGKYDLINLLLDKHADPNALDAWQKTPLVYVILYNFRKPDIRLVQLLLERGADPNKRITENATVLHVAAKEGKYDLINLLLDKHADPNAVDERHNTALFNAIFAILWNQNPDIRPVQLLLERGADPNKGYNGGATILHLAAREGHNALVRLLLDKGAKINIKDDIGNTPLDMAGSHRDTAELLRSRGGTSGQRKM